MTLKDLIQDKLRPVLSDKKILEYNKQGLLISQTITTTQLQPNSVDLTLGNTWKRPLPNDHLYMRDVINPMKPIEYEEGTFKRLMVDGVETDKEVYILGPGEFILMASQEVLNIPNGILAFVQGRSSIARLGQQTEQAGLIDAGFKGTITFEVFNETEYPMVFYKGMRVAQLYFFKAMKALHPYGSMNKGSKYQLQLEATGSRINQDPEWRN